MNVVHDAKKKKLSYDTFLHERISAHSTFYYHNNNIVRYKENHHMLPYLPTTSPFTSLRFMIKKNIKKTTEQHMYSNNHSPISHTQTNSKNTRK